jgi:hypothetical protein
MLVGIRSCVILSRTTNLSHETAHTSSTTTVLAHGNRRLREAAHLIIVVTILRRRRIRRLLIRLSLRFARCRIPEAALLALCL